MVRLVIILCPHHHCRYRGFLRDCPSGQLDRAEFLKLYKQFFPFGEPSAFVDYVFHVFDQDKNGLVDFKEFMVALSVSSRGKLEERIECTRGKSGDFLRPFFFRGISTLRCGSGWICVERRLTQGCGSHLSHGWIHGEITYG